MSGPLQALWKLTSVPHTNVKILQTVVNSFSPNVSLMKKIQSRQQQHSWRYCGAISFISFDYESKIKTLVGIFLSKIKFLDPARQVKQPYNYKFRFRWISKQHPILSSPGLLTPLRWSLRGFWQELFLSLFLAWLGPHCPDFTITSTWRFLRFTPGWGSGWWGLRLGFR